MTNDFNLNSLPKEFEDLPQRIIDMKCRFRIVYAFLTLIYFNSAKKKRQGTYFFWFNEIDDEVRIFIDYFLIRNLSDMLQNVIFFGPKYSPLKIPVLYYLKSNHRMSQKIHFLLFVCILAQIFSLYFRQTSSMWA